MIVVTPSRVSAQLSSRVVIKCAKHETVERISRYAQPPETSSDPSSRVPRTCHNVSLLRVSRHACAAVASPVPEVRAPIRFSFFFFLSIIVYPTRRHRRRSSRVRVSATNHAHVDTDACRTNGFPSPLGNGSRRFAFRYGKPSRIRLVGESGEAAASRKIVTDSNWDFRFSLVYFPFTTAQIIWRPPSRSTTVDFIVSTNTCYEINKICRALSSFFYSIGRPLITILCMRYTRYNTQTKDSC